VSDSLIIARLDQHDNLKAIILNKGHSLIVMFNHIVHFEQLGFQLILFSET